MKYQGWFSSGKQYMDKCIELSFPSISSGGCSVNSSIVHVCLTLVAKQQYQFIWWISSISDRNREIIYYWWKHVISRTFGSCLPGYVIGVRFYLHGNNQFYLNGLAVLWYAFLRNYLYIVIWSLLTTILFWNNLIMISIFLCSYVYSLQTQWFKCSVINILNSFCVLVI